MGGFQEIVVHLPSLDQIFLRLVDLPPGDGLWTSNRTGLSRLGDW